MRRFLLLAACPALAACQAEPDIAVTNATIAAGPRSAAIYATIANRGGADRLTGIAVDGRVPIGLHVTSNDGGVARMRAAETLAVPAKGALKLESGGAHGMAMGRIEADPPLVPLTFRFERSAPVTVSAQLTRPGAMEAHR